jgi:PAS domain S-box-containing protein
LLATAVSAAFADYFWIEPVGSITISNPADLLSIVVFLVSCTLISYLAEVAYRAQDRAHKAETQLEITAAREKLIAVLQESEERYRVTLSSIGDAVIATDASGLVTFLNPVAAKLTGWESKAAMHQPIQNVFRIINEQTRQPAVNVVERVLREGNIVNLANHTALITRDGREIPIEDSAAPIRDKEGSVSGVVLVFHDVTEKRRAQEALRASERLYRAIGESIEYGVWVCAPDGRNTYASESFLKLVGITQEECSDFGWGEVLHPEDAERTIAAWKECVRTGGIWDIEHRFLGVDGQWHPILARGVPVRDEAGEIVCWAGINLDISERKRAEENVARLAAIVESSNDAIIGKTLDGEITTWNRAAEEIYGYTCEEVVGLPISILAPDDRPDEVPAILQRISCGEDAEHYDTIRRRKDGQSIHVALTVSAIRDASGKIIGASTIARDITERKLMEEDLRKSRDELEMRVRERTAELVSANEDLRQQAALLNLSHDAIFVVDSADVVSFWNKGAEDLYGFTREQAIGNVAYEFLHTRFPESLEQVVNEVIDKGRWAGELSHTTSGGEELVVESRWALRRGEDSKPTGFLSVNRDITARKLAEESLRSNMERLELVNAELQEFAFVASHDLQEPLRKIQTFCDLAQKRCAPVLDSTGKDYLDRIVNSASRMRQLLSDLLQFSRVATRPEPFKIIDLAKIVLEASDVFQSSFRETGCQIEIENMPAIEADETQMLRLFQNLIGNALKFRGGETPRIKVYGKLDRKRTCDIFVKDNGIGFDPSYAELIFKPFQRLHGRSEYEGTGMGLAICRKIVERHGGSIRAESVPGKGSTFIIRLPVKQSR